MFVVYAVGAGSEGGKISKRTRGQTRNFAVNVSLGGADIKVGNGQSTYARITDAERSETPGGSYLRILPGRSIKSPSIKSSVSLHGSSNSNDGAAESVDVQGAQLDSIERSVNGRSKSTKGMGRPGGGTEGMRIALRMLLTKLQSVSACKFQGTVSLCFAT